MMKPKISIIVPVYNAVQTLSRCLDSVLAQSFRDFEVIVVNDGSQDGSGTLCDQYVRKDDRIHVIHQENSGVSAARNVGLRRAEGTYITFIDSDDWILPSHLEQLYDAAIQYECDVVVGGFTIIGRDSSHVCMPTQTGCFSGEIWEEICRDSSIYGYLWNKLFRADLIRYGDLQLCETMYSQEDLDFCLSVIGAAESVALISCHGYQYDYLPGKRIPPFWDYISNQIKILCIGSPRTELSADAQACVHKRILALLYTGLYEASGRDDYDNVVEKITRVEGLPQLLQSVSAKGEHGFVARNFAAGKYGRIRRYFLIRNRIRDVVRTIRKRKPE